MSLHSYLQIFACRFIISDSQINFYARQKPLNQNKEGSTKRRYLKKVGK